MRAFPEHDREVEMRVGKAGIEREGSLVRTRCVFRAMLLLQRHAEVVMRFGIGRVERQRVCKRGLCRDTVVPCKLELAANAPQRGIARLLAKAGLDECKASLHF